MATELIRGLCNLKPRHRGCVATIGNFDGLHIGHQALLQAVKKQAAVLQVPSVVITFEPLPKEFFRPDNPVPRLTRCREKFNFLSHYGVDKVLVIHFNQQFANMTAHDFVEKILHHGLGVKHVIIGDDFHFGHQREGSFTFLKKLGQQYGFTIEDMPSVMLNHERVSSTLVRDALRHADHQLVAKLLNRPYTMQGRIVHGHKRGRTIGFPTANIYLHREVTPVKGVYAVRMHGIHDTALPGVANVGVRPTIGGTQSLLEVHLFDFNRDIYGKHVEVEFCEKLRDEKKFDNLDLLKQQIWKDAEQARRYFMMRGENVI